MRNDKKYAAFCDGRPEADAEDGVVYSSTGNITYTTTAEIEGPPDLTNGTSPSVPDYSCCTCFPALVPLDQKKTFLIHEVICSESDYPHSEILEKAAQCFETIHRDGLKRILPKISIPPEARKKHVLLLGRTRSGKSLLGNVLNERYGYHGNLCFKTSSDPRKSQTRETYVLGNEDRMVEIYDNKGFFDWTDWDIRNCPRTKEGRWDLLAKEYREIWETVVHSGGIDSIALVLGEFTRFDKNDAQLAKLATKKLLKGRLRSRLFIVVTHSQICRNARNQQVDPSIVRSEMEKAHFIEFFKLVGNDTERVIFVDNMDPSDKNRCVRKYSRFLSQGRAKISVSMVCFPLWKT